MTDFSTDQGCLSCSLRIVGALFATYTALKLLHITQRALRTLFTSSGLRDIKSHGSWAVITGATDGIGKAYAEQLAAKGLNIVLISRTLSKLQAVSSAIETAYNVKTKIIAVDFTKGMEIYPHIEKQLANIDIGVLVNNVASILDQAEYFHLVPNREEKYAAIINCNVLSVTQMTSLVLPSMVAKRRGIIINISSLTGTFYCPLLTVYSATKSFVSTFTRSLQVEYASHGVLIQLVTPSYVVSNMSQIKEASFFAPTATAYVQSALATLGTESDTQGYFSHFLMYTFGSTFVPMWLSGVLAMRHNSAVRDRALQASASKKCD